MAIEDVTELQQVNGQTQAQRLLDEGWRILAVCVIQDGSSQYAEYHLGRVKPAEIKPAPKMPTAADLARANQGL